VLGITCGKVVDKVGGAVDNFSTPVDNLPLIHRLSTGYPQAYLGTKKARKAGFACPFSVRFFFDLGFEKKTPPPVTCLSAQPPPSQAGEYSFALATTV